MSFYALRYKVPYIRDGDGSLGWFHLFETIFVFFFMVTVMDIISDVKNDISNAMGVIQKGFAFLETEQSKINKAIFESLTQEQRDTFCRSLSEQNVKPKRIEAITGKSQSTVSRHLNGKNS